MYLFKKIIVLVVGKANSLIYYFASQQFASIICFMKSCLRFFFDCSIVHLVFAVYVVYIYYFQLIRDYLISFCEFLKTNTFSISDAIDYFN